MRKEAILPLLTIVIILTSLFLCFLPKKEEEAVVDKNPTVTVVKEYDTSWVTVYKYIKTTETDTVTIKDTISTITIVNSDPQVAVPEKLPEQQRKIDSTISLRIVSNNPIAKERYGLDSVVINVPPEDSGQPSLLYFGPGAISTLPTLWLSSFAKFSFLDSKISNTFTAHILVRGIELNVGREIRDKEKPNDFIGLRKNFIILK